MKKLLSLSRIIRLSTCAVVMSATGASAQNGDANGNGLPAYDAYNDWSNSAMAQVQYNGGLALEATLNIYMPMDDLYIPAPIDSTSYQGPNSLNPNTQIVIPQDPNELTVDVLIKRHRTAIRYWENAMRAVNANLDSPRLSLIYTLAAQTLDLGNQLHAIAASNASKCKSSINTCVSTAYRPVLAVYNHGFQTIMNYLQFDRETYYISMRKINQCSKCATDTTLVMPITLTIRENLNKYAVEQINWFISEFQGKSRLTGDTVAYYSKDVYYVVLNSILKHLSSLFKGETLDANALLFSTAYAREANLMDALSKRVELHICGNNTNPRSFIFVVTELEKLVEYLKAPCR